METWFQHSELLDLCHIFGAVLRSGPRLFKQFSRMATLFHQHMYNVVYIKHGSDKTSFPNPHVAHALSLTHSPHPVRELPAGAEPISGHHWLMRALTTFETTYLGFS